MGPRRLIRHLREGARPSAADPALLVLPVAGAAATELAPVRRAVDPKVAAVMVATAAVNAVGEELLRRGTYLEWFPDDPWRGVAWPWIGFTVPHDEAAHRNLGVRTARRHRVLLPMLGVRR